MKTQGLEGMVGKNRNSPYEPGQRSGAWQKMRVVQGQEFLIAGYTPAPKNFDGDRVVEQAFKQAHAKQIELDIIYNRRQLRLRIQDNGKGIDPKILGAYRKSSGVRAVIGLGQRT